MIAYTNYFVPPARIRIENIFDAVPEKRLPPTFATRRQGIDFFDSFLGIREVSFAEDMKAADMLKKLLDEFFKENLVSPQDIQWLTVIDEHRGSSSGIPNIGHYLQHTYNICNANVIQLSGNHCSNMEYAIAYSLGILKAFPNSHILLLATNRMESLQDRLVGAYAIKGDGAAIAYLNNVSSRGIDILGTYALTNGAMYEADVNTSNLVALYKDYTTCLRGLIEKFNITPPDISYVIIQNANHLLTVQTLQMLGFKDNQIYLDNLGTYGHLDCIDFIVNLQTVCRQSLVSVSKLITFGTGYAGSNIAMYLEIKQ